MQVVINLQSDWGKANNLQFNADKTKVMIFSRRYKIERPIEKGGNFMYVFHYLSDHELTPTLDHEHTDFGYYQK